MEWITTWADTGPSWLGGIGGIISTVVAIYALWRAARADRRHVEWLLSNERKADGRPSENWRLVNTTSGVRARVTDFENISDGPHDAVRGALDVPCIVEPGNWMPLNHSRSLVSPYPTVVRVTWQEGVVGAKRFRRRAYSSTLYID